MLPHTVEVVAYDEELGDYSVQVKELETVVDLQRGLAEHFRIVGEPAYEIGSQEAVLVNTDAYPTMNDVREAIRQHLTNEPRPHARIEDGVSIAVDVDTLHYFSLMHSLERATSFFAARGAPESSTSDLVVALFPQPYAYWWAPFPGPSERDAYYAADFDGLTFGRHHDDSLPNVLNEGTVAHEMQHRVFAHSATFYGSEAVATLHRRIRMGEVAGDRTYASAILLFGFDEGLADVAALAHTRDRASLERSYPDRTYRNVESNFAMTTTADVLFDADALSTIDEEACKREALPGTSSNHYCLGALLSRALYVGAGTDLDVLADDVFPAVIRALPAMGQRTVEASTDDDFVFVESMFFEPFIQELDAALVEPMCVSLKSSFGSRFVDEEVPSCPL